MGTTQEMWEKYEVVEDFGFKTRVSQKGTKTQKLIYKIDLSGVKRDERRWEIMDFLNEYKGLHLLPCMANLSESYTDQYHYYVVQEISSSGNLHQEWITWCNGNVTIAESSLKLWVAQLLLALNALHRRKVIHGAVIPENVFFSGRKDNIRLGPTSEFLHLQVDPTQVHRQISTFKTAKALDSRGGSDRFITAMTGLESLEHIAPEMFNPTGEIAYSNDVWGLGVIIYRIMAGKAPFTGNTPVQVVMAIEKCKPDFDSLVEKGYSQDLVNIVKKMLEKDESKRPSAGKLLDHKYFSATMCFG